MKKNGRKFLIMTLVVTFSLAAVICCCMPDVLEAKEEVMSCHQTSQAHEPAQKTDDCDCDDTLAILAEKVDSPIDLTGKYFLIADVSFPEISPQSSLIVADHAPPQINDTLPLYIKNAVLRI